MAQSTHKFQLVPYAKLLIATSMLLCGNVPTIHYSSICTGTVSKQGLLSHTVKAQNTCPSYDLLGSYMNTSAKSEPHRLLELCVTFVLVTSRLKA